MGPWIVTADEVDPENLDVKCWVNGELRQDANTRDLIFDIPTLIATISAGLTLQPGDLIATGTPAGVGIGFYAAEIPEIRRHRPDRDLRHRRAREPLRLTVAHAPSASRPYRPEGDDRKKQPRNPRGVREAWPVLSPERACARGGWEGWAGSES